MKTKTYSIYTFLFLIFGFIHTNLLFSQKGLDIEGHRGCRGLMPENTIPAMKKALDLHVVTLELDVVISKDKKVVVSHDPFFESDFSLTPDGKEIPASEEKKHNLYKMDYELIKKYDVGSKPHPKFPGQKKMKTYKPLLTELIDSVEQYVVDKQISKPFYNIEIKSDAKEDNIFQPEPVEFVSLVMEIIQNKGIEKRVIIQSFDARPLQVIHKTYPEIKLAFLVANLKSVKKNINKLGFVPDIYSPYYKLVKEKTVAKCHELDMKIVPWTVNTKERIDELLNMKVDGIITDYPNLFSNSFFN